ncbi:conserved Plasmodium protein, unknown function [Plasmodium vinckei vinckei]|uniref:Uncharacterized protein n=1 Tax=Plasmodium vinckei vinckei TaxID=54757 RepID=A0A449BQA6_PLAVN|nr:conserved Plasmodium protein, unknown function [Plasmodium vinckei vinckei]VEV55647.1 conserved Plasmodium protein, unknown function [Plasmodium vinckei vinckei]
MTGETTNGKDRINTFLETNENQPLESEKTNTPLEENTKEMSDNIHIKSYDDINNDNAPNIISKQSFHESDDQVGTIEDKIIKNYLSKQANSFGINIFEKNDTSNVVDTSSSDTDSTPLLDIFKKEELQKKRKLSKSILKKREDIKSVKRICDSETSENDEAKNKNKNNKYLIDLNPSKTKEFDNSNCKKDPDENCISSDDELLISLIKEEQHKNAKSSKNKFNNNKKEGADTSSCDASDYDSDEVLIVKSKKKDNNKIVHNNLGNKKSVVSIKNAKLIPLKHNNSAKNKAINKAKIKAKNKEKNIGKNNKTTIKDIGKIRKLGKKQTNKNVEKKKKKIQKKKLVAQLLTRWWYVLPDWPIPYYDYTNELETKKLKLVSLEEFEDHEDIDKNGFKKVYEISAFPGVFRDSLGTAYDLRDKETCPCYNNFIKKSDLELLQLICTAIKNQMDCLKNSVYNETYKKNILEKELNEVESKLRKVMDKNAKIVE